MIPKLIMYGQTLQLNNASLEFLKHIGQTINQYILHLNFQTIVPQYRHV